MRSEYSERAKAAKRYGKMSGYHGHVGGWIFSPTGAPTRCQGWSEFGRRLERQGFIAPTNGARRYDPWKVTTAGAERALKWRQKLGLKPATYPDPHETCKHELHRRPTTPATPKRDERADWKMT